MGLESWTYLDGVDGWPDAGLGTLVYGELKDSGNSQINCNNSMTERRFIIDWDQDEIFLLDLLGWGYWDAGNHLKRHLPDQHPRYTSFYAISASLEPWGKPGKDPDIPFQMKNFWKVTAQYEAVPYAILPDDEGIVQFSEAFRFCSSKYAFQTQMLSTSSYFQFETPVNGERNKIAAQPAVRASTTTFQVTWNQVPSVDTAPFRVPNEGRIRSLQGKINNSEFMGYETACVLFVGADAVMSKPKVSSTVGDPGLYTWDITFTFMVKDEGLSALFPGERIGWRYAYDLAANRWDHVRSIVGNEYPYQSGGLYDLFTVG